MRNLLDWEYAFAQSEVMRTFGKRGATVRAGLTLMLALGATLGAPSDARASVFGGCAGTYDTGVPGTVGWVDSGVMLGVEAARPPASFEVVGPDGTTTTYPDGVGLIPPTDSMPLWFAPVDQVGDYIVTIAEEVCSAAVTELAEIVVPDLPLDTVWVSRSAPIPQH
jgi:hypothetical protein